MTKDTLHSESGHREDKSSGPAVGHVQAESPEEVNTHQAGQENATKEAPASEDSNNTHGGHPWPEDTPLETDDTGRIIPPRRNVKHQNRERKRQTPKREFNPWAELDKASKKNVSRRDLITGFFRFLPKNDDK